MDMLSKMSVIVCVCCIVCSIISMFVPLGRMNKTLNLVLGLFLLTSIIIPVVSLFSGLSSEISLNFSDISQSTSADIDYDKLVLNTTADNLVKAADELLKNEDVNAKNITLSLKKTEDNSIYISDIVIYITKEYMYREDDIKKIVSTNMSKEPVIVYND